MTQKTNIYTQEDGGLGRYGRILILDKENMIEKEQNKPLLPDRALEYFDDAMTSKKDYLKAVILRNCLEIIMDTVLIYVAETDGNSVNWKKKNLQKKISSLKIFFPTEIIDSIQDIRTICNKGAHASSHKDLTDRQLHEIVEKLKKVCEWVIITYLEKNGYNTIPWVPTVLSTLQPIYRINILEKLFSIYTKQINNKEYLLEYQQIIQEKPCDLSVLSNNNKNNVFEQVLLVIDKLAMAYLKNREYKKSIEFVNSCSTNGFINTTFKEDMLWKLESLWRNIDSFPIARNSQQTKANLSNILPKIREDEYSLFLVLFMAIVAENELDNYPHIASIGT